MLNEEERFPMDTTNYDAALARFTLPGHWDRYLQTKAETKSYTSWCSLFKTLPLCAKFALTSSCYQILPHGRCSR